MATNYEFTKHAVVGTSQLLATNGGAKIFSIKAAADIDNGSIVGLGAYEAPEYYAEAAATTFTGEIVDVAANGNFYVQVKTASNAYLVASVPLIYEDWTHRFSDESNFFNAAGDLMRCYELVPTDIFEVSAEGIEGVAAKGADVIVTDKKVTVV